MARLLLVLLLVLSAVPVPAEELQTVTVRPGDTLWSISNTYLKDPKRWNELLKYNRLPAADPSIALPGMQLKIPVRLIKEQYRAAKLVYFLNDVLLRRSGISDWKGVAMDMDLYKDDTLRTQAAARADVRFFTGQVLNLYPNSMAVLRPPEDKNTDVKLLAGAMRGLRSRVVTPGARITPKTRDTEFGARITDDLTTMVQVYKGKADVEAQGKHVEVPAGFASEVKMDNAPSRPVKLPPMPELEEGSLTRLAAGSSARLSSHGGVVSLTDVRPPKAGAVPAALPREASGSSRLPAQDAKAMEAGDIVKMISVGNPVQAYHLQVSRTPAFTSTVLDKEYQSYDTINLNSVLPPGEYYMRVALVDLLGFEGKFSAPRPIKVGAGR